MVGMTPTRISPVIGARPARASSITSSASRRSACARSAMRRPVGVISTRRFERSAIGMPSTDSSSRMPALSVDWVMWQRSAARPKCRVSASATRYWSCFIEGRRFIGIDYRKIRSDP